MVTLSYESLLERLFSLSHAYDKRIDLSLSFNLARLLNHPERKYPSVHIAGTNGKGSVAFKIAKCLQRAGLRVGLYTSPHLFSFQERISINGTLISEEDVMAGLSELFSLIDVQMIQPSFFEMTTILAFDYFRKKQVDIAVVETGLGGRLDATNILYPLLTVITSISREHVQILGQDLEAIAKEKAGIIKENVPLVVGPHAKYNAIFERARSLNCPIYQVAEKDIFFDEENQRIAKLSITLLSNRLSLNFDQMQEGLKSRPLCRFENKAGMIWDVAHNPQGFFRLIEALELHYPKNSYRMLVGMSQDKEISECLKVIAPKAKHLHFVQANNERAASPQLLAWQLKQIGFFACSEEKSILEGIQNAKAALQKNEILVICGSFYIMQEAQVILGME